MQLSNAFSENTMFSTFYTLYEYYNTILTLLEKKFRNMWTEQNSVFETSKSDGKQNC